MDNALRQAAQSASQASQSISEVSKNTQGVAANAQGATTSVNVLGRSFTSTAVAIGAVTTAIKLSIDLVRRSISEYTELAEATRQLRYQTGILSRESSQYVQAFQAAGLSSTSAARGMTQFLNKVTDLNRDLKSGKENTSDFAVAMEFLGVEITDGAKNLKSTEQLLNEVSDAFQRLGPGVRTAEAAQSLFGIAAYRLLPLLTDQNTSIQDLMDITERYGSSLGALTQGQYSAFTTAQFELRAAMQAVYNHIATQWIPVLTQVYRIVANVINIYLQFIKATQDTTGAQQRFVDRLRNAADALETLSDKLEIIINNYRILLLFLDPARAAVYAMRVAMGENAQSAEELADAEEAAAQAGFDLAQAAADVTSAMEDQLKALDKLKTQFAQKMADINAEAAQSWNDILVNRQRDAFDRALQLAWRLDDIRAAYNERLDAIEADAAKRWDNILVNRQRQAIERGYRLAYQYEDLARETEKRRNDAIRNASEKEKEIRKDAQKRITDAEKDAQEKREKLEQEHRRRLRDIQQKYLDTVTEAARQNDAVTVARAMRERARAVRDEEQRYTDEQRDLADSLAKKRQEIEQDRREREADHRAELQRTLRRIEENYQEQLAEIGRQQAREAAARERQYQQELDDFNKAKEDQKQAAKDAYDKQIAELEKQQAREAALRKIQYERQEIDFVKNWQRRINEARTWYERERNELAQHLNMTGEMLEAAYEDWIQGAADAVRRVTDALAAEVARYQQYLSEVERRRIQTQYQGSQITTSSTATTSRSARVSGQPIFGTRPGMAAGGVVQATRPTSVLMGEAGPETAVFMPGRAGSMNVNHNFGRLGVDFGGLPGGMNTQQVQAIVYQVMIQLAKGIQIPR
jgi:hypothetical protein